jgi:XTP/dITP diphosphohydrolase
MTIEETYELADAITENDWKGIKRSWAISYCTSFLFEDRRGQGQFTLEEVLKGISEKLIARHPHIYGDVKVDSDEDVKRNWEKLKLKEGKRSVLAGVPQSLPATVKAMRLQEKASQVGFEWENKDQVWQKVEEETAELKEVIDKGNQEKIEEEFGDLVFSLINYARFLHIDAENALERTNKKFIHRFTQMEQQAMTSGKDLENMTLDEMDAIWNSIKQQGQL